jgi:hypothetical protein
MPSDKGICPACAVFYVLNRDAARLKFVEKPSGLFTPLSGSYFDMKVCSHALPSYSEPDRYSN